MRKMFLCFAGCAAFVVSVGFRHAADQPLAARLGDASLNSLVGGDCGNRGCTDTTICDTTGGISGNNCAPVTTTCSPFNGICKMIVVNNGPKCNVQLGYENCQMTTTTTNCASVATGMPADDGSCTGRCTTPGIGCGNLQVTCSATQCQGSPPGGG